MTQYEAQISYENFRHAKQLAYRRIYVPHIIAIVSVVVVAVLTYVYISEETPEGRQRVLVYPVVWGVFSFLLYYSETSKWPKQYQREKCLQHTCQCNFDENGITVISPVETTHRTWDSYSSWMQSEDVFALFLPRGQMQIFAKTGFATESELQAFRQYLGTAISKE